MIIRFLDGKENCYQVDTHKTPILICLETQKEVDYVKQVSTGGCIVSIPSELIPDKETSERVIKILNTTKEPKNLK